MRLTTWGEPEYIGRVRGFEGMWGSWWWEVETRRMGRAALEDGLGRGSYVVGAQWDEGNMVHAMKRFGGTTVGWRFGDEPNTRWPPRGQSL